MTISLSFILDVRDGWPPVGSESIAFDEVGDGYKVLVAPLFVKDISVGDVISPSFEDDGFIKKWQHKSRSGRSVIWLLRIADSNEIDSCLSDVRKLGCNTAGVDDFGCYNIDVPENVPIKSVDEILLRLNDREVAVAYPSFRHVD